jgi:sugar-specific transcriptional regulator TrmB
MRALVALGLSEQEADLYEVILRLGDGPIANVLKTSGLHPQIVYRIVDRLKARGFLHTSTQKHRTFVRAEDPRALQQKEEHKLEAFRAAIPALLALQTQPKDALVSVARGIEAVQALRARGIDELQAGDTYYVLGASGDRFYEIMGETYLTIERRRERKKIRRKLLAFESQRQLIARNEPPTKLVEHRFLPSSLHVPSSTNIFGSTVAILVWTEEPIVITIESVEVADSYREYFASLWKIAKPAAPRAPRRGRAIL